jgi:hypothetical protein
VERLLAHHLIVELLECRNHRLDEIQSQGKIVDAFGRTLPRVTGATESLSIDDLRSLAAQEVQSYELELMLAALPVLEKCAGELHVFSFLHDGMTISARNKGREQMYAQRIKRAVDFKAAEKGFHTWLEVKAC